MTREPAGDDGLTDTERCRYAERFFNGVGRKTMTPEELQSALAAARKRSERAARRPLYRVIHWVHARQHPFLHQSYCRTCRKRTLDVNPDYLLQSAQARLR